MWRNQHLCFSSERFYLFVCLCVRQETLKQRGNIRGGKGPSNEFVYFFFIWNVLFVYLFVSQPRDSETEVECTKVAKGQVMCLCVFFHPTGFVCLFVCVSAKRFSNRGGMYKGGKGPARCRTSGAGRAKISLSWRTLVSQLFRTLGLVQIQFQTTTKPNEGAPNSLCLCVFVNETFCSVRHVATYNVQIKESWIPGCVRIK